MLAYFSHVYSSLNCQQRNGFWSIRIPLDATVNKPCRCFLLNFISEISTTGPLGAGITTTSTTLRTTTLGAGRSTTPSASGRRNRSTSSPSPAVEVLDDITTHLPSASSQVPALEESCEAVEAREIMWFKTRQGQTAKQPCPAGTIGESVLPGQAKGACSLGSLSSLLSFFFLVPLFFFFFFFPVTTVFVLFFFCYITFD